VHTISGAMLMDIITKSIREKKKKKKRLSGIKRYRALAQNMASSGQ
jgi:hypothetical protein